MSVADFPGRVVRAAAAVATAGNDALLVTPGPDLRWLTGYDAVALERLTCLVVPGQAATGDAGPVLVVPRLERPAAEAALGGARGVAIADWGDGDDPYAVVADLIGGGAGSIAVDARMPARHVLALRRVLPNAEQHLASSLLDPLRSTKDEAEVEALRAAGAAIDRVHARVRDWLKPGRTEREVGRDIADAIVAEGHERADFVIVGSGPNAASPHHALSDRVVEPGDVVVVDIGGTMPGGYCSDSTRTYAVGEPPPEATAYYEVLLRAQEAACAAVRPGVPLGDVDRAARDPITDAGYGDQFIHRTGHGIGLETHEAPYVTAGNAGPLVPGMAFSIEPGIYLPGRHGARIEDIVVCTEDGGERLNRRPRQLAVLEG
jgi:Xaa-Pro aminopeptidase